MAAKRLAILGSTGSIGTQTLDVVRSHPELFRVDALAANTSDEALERQIEEFHPAVAVLVDENAAARLRERYRGNTEILSGEAGLRTAATFDEVDTVVTSMVGFAGLAPTLAALKARKTIALANKETLVVAGELVTALAKEKGVSILPVDSEHCALFQCLQGERRDTVERLILTASGGPFRGKTTEELKSVTVADCLRHPTWSMGKKITVDSATLVNKGLEVIEAHWLYDVPYEKIEVAVHPQSIVHSMVEFIDGSVMAQLGNPDMKVPIQLALTWPFRARSETKRLDLAEIGQLTFERPRTDAFPCLALAYRALGEGGVLPAVLNGANEAAVESFLKGRLGFTGIPAIIEAAMNAFPGDLPAGADNAAENNTAPELRAVLAADNWAREYVRRSVL